MRVPGAAEEVPDVEARVAVPVEAQHALDLGDGRPAGRGGLPAPIEQAVIAVALVAPAQSANAAGTPAEDVRGLGPGELPTEGS